MSVWIVSVGSTDVQLPVYEKITDAYGVVEWRLSCRAEIPEGGRRVIHESMERLARKGRVTYLKYDEILASTPVQGCTPRLIPRFRPRESERPPMVELAVDEDGESFVAEYAEGKEFKDRFRLSPGRDQVSEKFPVILPKIEPVLKSPLLSDDAPTAVFVLNTRRTDNEWEPVAAGPLVAQRVAQALELNWAVVGTWPIEDGVEWDAHAISIDTIRGREKFEVEKDQDLHRQRLIQLCRLIEARFPQERIVVTNTGGAPRVKDLVWRAIQGYFGEKRVSLLSVSEQTDEVIEQQITRKPSWDERDKVRFEVARALRERRVMAAFGLAAMLANSTQEKSEDWVGQVIDTLGPLCTLSAAPSLPRQASPFGNVELAAFRCEVALFEEDYPKAIIYMGALFEMLLGEFIIRDPFFNEINAKLDSDGQTLKINKENKPRLIKKNKQFDPASQFPLIGRFSGGDLYIRKGFSEFRSWCGWLDRRPVSGPIPNAIKNLKDLYSDYGKSEIRRLRNKIAHHTLAQDSLDALKSALRGRRLLSPVDPELRGRLTLLGNPRWTGVLEALCPGEQGMAGRLDEELDRLLDAVRAPGSTGGVRG